MFGLNKGSIDDLERRLPFTRKEILVLGLLFSGVAIGLFIDGISQVRGRGLPDLGPISICEIGETDLFSGAEKARKDSSEIIEKGGPVNINTADEKELQRLIGIGPALAKNIIEYRKKYGRFKSADELDNVKGIGPAKLAKMREQVIIGK